MKKLLTPALALFPAILLAQAANLGAKPDIVAKTTSATSSFGVMEAVQILVALAIVGALIRWGLPWAMGRMNGLKTSGGRLVVKESAPVGAGQIHLLEVEGRTLLIGTTSQTISCLADLSNSTGANAQPEEKVFFEILDDAVAAPEMAPIDRNHAVIERPIEAPAEPEEEEMMTIEEAVALIKGAKTRTGINPESEPKTQAKEGKPKTDKGTNPINDDEVLAMLDRISRLSK